MNILQTPITNYSKQEIINNLCHALTREKQLLVTYINIHSIMLALKNERLANIFNQKDTLSFVDGVGVKLAYAFLYRKNIYRNTPPDFIFELFQVLPKNTRVYFLGDTQKNVDKVVSSLTSQYRHIEICGQQSGYFKALEVPLVVEKIARTQPDMLIIGMGMPKQEFFVEEYKKQLPSVKVFFCVGALYRYMLWPILRGPKIVTEYGLEWLWRSLFFPQLFFTRYILEIPLFFVKIVKLWSIRYSKGKRDHT